jgi:hypothetical protein
MIILLAQQSSLHWKAKCTKKFWGESMLPVVAEMFAYK